MVERAIIFCQAPGEIGICLNLYEKCLKDGYTTIYIICVHKPSMNKFLSSLNLKAIILYYDTLYAPKYAPIPWILNKILVKRRVSALQLQNADEVIVFFTSCFDLNLSLYLKYFLKYKIYYINNTDKLAFNKDFNKNKNSLKNMFLSFLSSIILCCKQIRYFVDGRFSYIIDIKHYKNIIEIPFDFDKSVYTRYTYNYTGISSNNSKPVLFFTEPYRFKFQTKENYDTLNIATVNELKKRGYYVCMKGHPTNGSHPLLKDIVDHEIPVFIPVQFLDLSIFSFAVGFVSSSLCSSSEMINSYSILDMCEITDDKSAQYLLESLAPVKIKYIKSYNEIPNL